MNIIEQGRSFIQSLRDLANRSAWDWRRCPKCGDTLSCKWGSYTRHPWFLEGRQAVRVQRHRCERCQRTYSEQSALLVRGSWYAREVHRAAIDHWQHLGSSVRRSAEWLRSLLGRQERWQLWRPLDPVPADSEQCHLSASTVERWLDRAGIVAQSTVTDQLAGVSCSGQVGVDGLWVRLRKGAKGVVLALVDSVSGLVYPPVVAGEESEPSWDSLVKRAVKAGLDLDILRGVTSDGAAGIAGYLERALSWVNHQRCVFHIWRNLGGEMARQVAVAAAGLEEDAAKTVKKQVRRELVALIHRVLDAKSEVAAQLALDELAAHPLGAGLAQELGEHLDAALVHLLWYNQGLMRVGPEWLWRDYRLRLGHGRNQGTTLRLERAALVWAIYRNFEPAQRRSERKRRYRWPGQSPLAVAGVPPGEVSYLDALAV
jgi:hypothetical protein